jgi:hypothetical protein
MSREPIRSAKVERDHTGFVVSVERGYRVSDDAASETHGVDGQMAFISSSQIQWRWVEVYRGLDKTKAFYLRDLYLRSG